MRRKEIDGSRTRDNRLGNASGLSLLEVLIVMTVSGIAILGLNKFMTNQFKGTAAAINLMDVLAVQNSVRQRFSCDKTISLHADALQPSGRYDCTALKAPFDIYDRKGQIIKNIGKWRLYGSCDPALNIVRVSADAGTATDPQSKKLLNDLKTAPGISIKDDLFGGTGRFCQSYFAGASDKPACDHGEIITNVDFENQSVTCAKGVLKGGFYSNIMNSKLKDPTASEETCSSANDMTGSCTCPSGFTPRLISRISQKCVMTKSALASKMPTYVVATPKAGDPPNIEWFPESSSNRITNMKRAVWFANAWADMAFCTMYNPDYADSSKWVDGNYYGYSLYECVSY